MSEKLKNTRGTVFYGMHFCPGVARYEPPNQEPFTIFINENVIRKMNPGFAGCPIFVEHIPGDVNDDIDELRGEADGWVVESFYNAADGKTWAKFMVTSTRGLEAIKNGWKLSNAYIPQCVEQSGQWNGVPYDRMVVGGEFEHLAIVESPRYEESEILTPEEFKAYNSRKTVELQRLANEKNKGDKTMKLNIWKRQKVENAADFDGMMVELPKSKKQLPLTEVIEEYDKVLNMSGYASGDHMVKINDSEEMSVNDLIKKHAEMANELEAMKKAKAGDDDEGMENEEDDEDPAMENDNEDVETGMDDVDCGGDESVENEEDVDDEAGGKPKPISKNSKDKKAIANAIAKKNAKAKAARLKNANIQNAVEEDEVTLSLSGDQVRRGQELYGSGK